MGDYYQGGGGGRYRMGGGSGFRGQGGGGRRDDSKRPDFYQNPTAELFCKLFLGGLNPSTSVDSLNEYFAKYGEIVDSIVMKDPQTDRSRNFGFVTFSCIDAVDAVQKDRPHTVDGKQIETKRATPKDEQNENSKDKCLKLFIGGLQDDISEDDLREEFGKTGEIQNIAMVYDKDKNARKNFCFITYTDHDHVDRCSLIRSFHIKSHKVDAKKAVDRDRQNNMDSRRGGGFGRGGRGGGRGGYGGGGYGGGGYGGGDGGYGGGYGGGGGGGYGGGSGGYNNGNDLSFGQDYNGGYGGGPMRGGGYSQRSSGPYGGSGGGGGGYSGGGGGGYDSYGSGSGGYGGGGGGYGGGGGGRNYQGR